MTMTKRALAAALCLAVTLPMYAGFAEVANAIDRQHGVKRAWIPFLGIARLFVRVARPEGVHDFQLVTFEGAGRLDPHKLQRLMAEKAGPGFVPLVRVWSRRSNEWSFIYVKPTGSRVEMMVLAHDDEDTVLVRIEVDADVLARNLDEPRHIDRMARR